MTSDAPLLSIIVVSYNTSAMTLACLSSVFETAPELDFELLVVDNASADGSADAIEATHGGEPRLRLERLNENIGFAGANNLAAETARGRYLLLLNPDTVVLDGALQALLAFATERPEAKIWGGRTLFGDMSLNPSSCWGRHTVWSCFCMATGVSRALGRYETFNPEPIGAWRRDSIREVDIVCGCFFLIETSFWRDLEGFDLRFFMYAEEADLCWRARDSGARPAITPDACIIHYGGASEPAVAPRIVRLYAGKLTLAAKHWSPAKGALGRALYRLHVINRWAAFAIAARLTGREPFKRHAETWRDVWRARSEWLVGYPQK